MTGRLLVLLPVVALIAAACSVAPQPSPAPVASPGTFDDAKDVELSYISSTKREGVPSALSDMNDERFPDALIDPSQIISGGPPPDGIPPVDEPKFQKVSDVGWLFDREPVVSLIIGDEARAYPVQILIWHEIVNDAIADIPVSITYCPLCNSAVAYDRRVGQRILDFGTSGRLFNSALVMYDRQTESLWTHFTGQAVVGHMAGVKLEILAAPLVSWGEFKRAHPTGWVLSRTTGSSRDYGANPYDGYDVADSRPFLFSGEIDDRLLPKQRMVGIEIEGESVGIVLEKLADRRVMEVEVAGRKLLVLHQPGSASALDSYAIAEGYDVGQTGVFDAEVDGLTPSLLADEGGFIDRETNSKWNIFGEATSGTLRGKKLRAVAHLDTFWFVWAAYRPGTKIIGN